MFFCLVEKSENPLKNFRIVVSVFCLLCCLQNIEAQNRESTEYRASRTRYMDLIHTKLEVSFDWKKQHLHGIATLDLTPYFFPQSDVVLDAKGMNINSVSILNGSVESALTFEYAADQLTIDLGKEFLRTDTLSIKIDYLAKPNERKLGGSDAIKSDKGLYFINPLNEEKNKPQQIWTQGETESNSAWFPTIDSPNEWCVGRINKEQ